MGESREISFEALALANFIVTKKLLYELVGSGVCTKPQVQTVFEAAKKELQACTLSIGPNEADELFSMIWPDYVAATGVKEN